MFRGSYTALITPLCDGEIDENAFVDLVNWQIEQGTHGLVPVGTTGEASTLSHDERIFLVRRCVEVVAGRVPVIAGVGSNCTSKTVQFAQQVHRVGASALLIVCPYYNKPNQAGLYQHFKTINDAVDLPQFIYNVPGRSGVDMSVETMSRLYELPNIVGLKDATANLARVSLQRHAMGCDFIQLSGDDATALGFNIHGGHGCISVTANVAPALCAQFQDACFEENWATALSIHDSLTQLHHALFMEPSPVPVKYAASLLGLCQPDTRLPLVSLSGETGKAVRDAMVHAELLIG